MHIVCPQVAARFSGSLFKLSFDWARQPSFSWPEVLIKADFTP